MCAETGQSPIFLMFLSTNRERVKALCLLYRFLVVQPLANVLYGLPPLEIG
jgi:hypothetical protein